MDFTWRISSSSSSVVCQALSRYTLCRISCSQLVANECCTSYLSDHEGDKLCLVYGPAGTGKTMVAVTCVQSLVNNSTYRVKRNVWLIARSNMAVQILAEQLAEVRFCDFRILAVKERRYHWYVGHHTFLFSAQPSNSQVRTTIVQAR